MTEKRVIVIITALTLIMLMGGVWLLSSQGAKEKTKLAETLLGEEIIENPSSIHVPRNEQHAPYKSNPPTQGPHWGDGVAGPGIKDTEVADELLIHSMEHGAVVVWYKPQEVSPTEGTPSASLASLSLQEVEKLKQIFSSVGGKKIMVPRKSMETPIALTSWGRLMKLQSLDEVTIKQFIETNNDRAPEKAPI